METLVNIHIVFLSYALRLNLSVFTVHRNNEFRKTAIDGILNENIVKWQFCVCSSEENTNGIDVGVCVFVLEIENNIEYAMQFALFLRHFLCAFLLTKIVHSVSILLLFSVSFPLSQTHAHDTRTINI